MLTSGEVQRKSLYLYRIEKQPQGNCRKDRTIRRQKTGMEEQIKGQKAYDVGRGSGRGRNQNRVSILALPVAVLLTASVTAGFFYLKYRQESSAQEGLVYEGNIIAGDIPGKTREERQRELDAVVEEGMLAMTINATPSGKTTGSDRNINWLIENPANQGKLIRVEVRRDDNGEKIYETGVIPPGNYVESAPLLVNMEAGEYKCTAEFYAYKEDETYLGQASAQIRLVLYE